MVSHNLRLELFCSLRFAPPPPTFLFFSFFLYVCDGVCGFSRRRHSPLFPERTRWKKKEKKKV